MLLNFTKNLFFIPKLYFLKLFFIPIFVSKLLKNLFTKFRHEKNNFLKFRDKKQIFDKI